MDYCTNAFSPLGAITLASDGKNLTGLWIQGQKYDGDAGAKEMMLRDDLPVFEQAKNWLDRYFAGQKPQPAELPLSPAGGTFRQGVWEILLRIPYGKLVTYGDIAREMTVRMNKSRMSAQAVGGAVGHNPISIVIPCHRVVGTNGSLTGYAGGIDLKVRLLELEGADMTNLFVPKKGTAL